MKTTTHHTIVLLCIWLLILSFSACRPLRDMQTPPQPWEGVCNVHTQSPANDTAKRNVFIIADYKLTELFDMLAPFYLFNETGKANVYIVANDRTPVLIKRDLFVIPQITFNEVDAMQLKADVIVIPALAQRTSIQDTLLIKWITNHFNSATKMLAICDGASTAAATGLYDGKLITCHASDYESVKAHFSKPKWVQNISVTKDGNLFSTAGVSNAVEGSLIVINELFGREIMLRVLAKINYPRQEIRTDHKSIAVTPGNKTTVVKKLLFRKNRDIGILLDTGVNEFDMVSVIDTYSRTFPATFAIYSVSDSLIQTKHGLTLISRGKPGANDQPDEWHVIMPGSVSKVDPTLYKGAELIQYDELQRQYPLEVCLKRIEALYGTKFKDVMKVSLDYN